MSETHDWYFNLRVNPIFRETYRLGDVKLKEKGYFITESCISCGNCYENCPVKAIERRGSDESK